MASAGIWPIWTAITLSIARRRRKKRRSGGELIRGLGKSALVHGHEAGGPGSKALHHGVVHPSCKQRQHGRGSGRMSRILGIRFVVCLLEGCGQGPRGQGLPAAGMAGAGQHGRVPWPQSTLRPLRRSQSSLPSRSSSTTTAVASQVNVSAKRPAGAGGKEKELAASIGARSSSPSLAQRALASPTSPPNTWPLTTQPGRAGGNAQIQIVVAGREHQLRVDRFPPRAARVPG